MKGKYFLFFFFIIIAHLTSAQKLHIGGTLNFAQSKIDVKNSSRNKLKSKFISSGNAGIFLEKKIRVKSTLGFEVLWVQMEGLQTINSDFSVASTGAPVRRYSTNEEYRNHYSFIGFPLYYKFQFHKLGIKTGFQPMLFLFANTHFSNNGE